MRLTAVFVLAIGLMESRAARAAEVLLSCRRTVDLIQQGKHVNPGYETSSVSVAVDADNRSITVNGITWTMSGDTSRETIVGFDPEKGSVTLNRITGAISAHFIELNGLKKFYGECKPAQKLF